MADKIACQESDGMGHIIRVPAPPERNGGDPARPGIYLSGFTDAMSWNNPRLRNPRRLNSTWTA